MHCTCTMHPSPFFIWRQVGLAKVQPCAEFGVASSNFTFTGGPHVKTASSPLALAAGIPMERYPQWILSWYSTRVTCELCPEMFGHTHRQTDKHQPPNLFSPTHRRKSSFIRTCYAMLNALAPFILYDFGLEAGTACLHCLGPKS